MISSETTTVQSTTKTYTTPAPDTSNIVAEVSNGFATITYGGSSLTIPVNALLTLTALTQMIGTATDPTAVPVVAAVVP